MTTIRKWFKQPSKALTRMLKTVPRDTHCSLFQNQPSLWRLSSQRSRSQSLSPSPWISKSNLNKPNWIWRRPLRLRRRIRIEISQQSNLSFPKTMSSKLLSMSNWSQPEKMLTKWSFREIKLKEIWNRDKSSLPTFRARLKRRNRKRLRNRRPFKISKISLRPLSSKSKKLSCRMRKFRRRTRASNWGSIW